MKLPDDDADARRRTAPLQELGRIERSAGDLDVVQLADEPVARIAARADVEAFAPKPRFVNFVVRSFGRLWHSVLEEAHNARVQSTGVVDERVVVPLAVRRGVRLLDVVVLQHVKSCIHSAVLHVSCRILVLDNRETALRIVEVGAELHQEGERLGIRRAHEELHRERISSIERQRADCRELALRTGKERGPIRCEGHAVALQFVAVFGCVMQGIARVERPVGDHLGRVWRLRAGGHERTGLERTCRDADVIDVRVKPVTGVRARANVEDLIAEVNVACSLVFGVLRGLHPIDE